MDALVSVALQEVAAEGAQGCSLPTLWGWLQSPSSVAGLLLDSTVKQAIWKLLLSTSCLTFEGAGCGPLACTAPSIQAFEDAERLDVHVIASEDLRVSFLGAYDIRHCDAKLSGEQRMILERLGKARANGVTQYQIGKEFGMSGKKLFYIIKNLESRGLVVRQSSIYRGERPVATNLIHLKRFAKDLKLGFHQRFEIQKAGVASLEHEGTSIDTIVEGGSQKSGVKDILVNDDLPALKAICKRLEEADNKVLVISDLKVSLGYRFTRGHRAWRRVLSRLVGAGLVEAFEAKVEKKVLPCIRLLKSFDLKAFSGKSNSMNTDEMGFEQNFKGAKRGQITEQVAELSINRQIYDHIKQGGSDGVAVTEIFTCLGINNRKNYFRLTEMIPKHGLRLKVENHKRSTQYRVWGPENPLSSQADAVDTEESKAVHKASLHKLGPLVQFGDTPVVEKEGLCVSDSPQQLAENVWPSEDATCAESDKPAEDRIPVTGLELVPYTEGGNLEATEQGMMPTNTVDIPTIAGQPAVSNESLPIAFSISSQRTVALSSAHTQREIWIMERLEREKFILRSELHKWLEDLEARKDTLLDRKTVVRNLQKLQKEGRCKCMLVSLPGVSNYGQIRTVDVVLLPSLVVCPDLLTEIYERQRAFDTLVRTQSSSRWRKSKKDATIPTLSGLKRMPKTEIVDKGGTLQDNGFISAKLVRCRMLHQFLWLYVSGLTDGNSHLHDCSTVHEHPNASGGGIFSLLVAVQSMPLELFLQVIGSTKHIKGLAERCRRGMRLSDLPTRESEALLDINASGRLSWLVDILRRLKLLRIVMIPAAIEDSLHKLSQAGVAYALELKPYIEEPALEPPSSISAHVLNLGPPPRHYFELSSKESLDEYWKSLEYFFRGSYSYVARRIFPGSTVPELFGPRSWSSLRVMTMDQRTELQRRIGLQDNRRLPYEECVQIARELNLSLDQVLGASYEKNQKLRLQEMSTSTEDPSNSSQIKIALGSRSSKGLSTKKREASSDGILESANLEITKRQHQSNHLGIEGHAQHPIRERSESTEKSKKKKMDKHAEMDDAKNDTDPSFVPQISVVRKFRPFRKKKYPWKDAADRVLIACYTRQRAILGARYNRVDWNSIPGLPAPPETCRRRIALLKMIPTVRKAMMALCNLLGTRYTKYLRLQSSLHNLGDDTNISLNDEGLGGNCSANNPSLSTNKGFNWDDFEDPSLSAAVNDIVRCKNAARPSSLKKMTEPSCVALRSFRAGRQSLPGLPDFNRTDAGETRLPLAAVHSDNCLYEGLAENAPKAADELLPGKSINEHPSLSLKNVISARARPNRTHVRKKLPRPTILKDVSSADMVQKSVGVAMAVELIKLVFLNSVMESEVSEILVDALSRCKESDIFTAFRFLKDQGMVAIGEDCQAFVLSPKFYNNSTSSPFGPLTSEESMKFETWLREMKTYLEQGWVTLRPEQQWGELFHLFATVLSGQLSIAPFLPEKGIGEKDQDEVTRKRKRDISATEETHVGRVKTGAATEEGGFGQRRERGFPGIKVKAHTATMAFESMLALESTKRACLEYPSLDDLSPSEGFEAAGTSKSSELVPFLQEKSLILESSDTMNKDTFELKNCLRTETLEERDGFIDLDDEMQMSTLKQVHAALLRAGEEGIRMGDGIELVGAEGNRMVEVGESYAKALNSFGLAREVMAFDHIRIVSSPHNERFLLHLPRPGLPSDDDSIDSHKNDLAIVENLNVKNARRRQNDAVEMVPVLPWLEADGKENAIMRKSLNRRVMGIVMLNPGVLEESIIEQVDVLNPTSCQKLLQLLVLDGHLLVRTQMMYDSAPTPVLLQGIISQKAKQRKCVYRRHYYANPTRSALL